MALKVEGHIDEYDHHGHFYQRPDDSRGCGSGINSKFRDCHC